MSGVESPSDPACDAGCEVVEALIPRGGADPTRNQLSGAVGGRASSALISIVKASLRAVFRGGSVVDGCGTAARLVLRRCLRLLLILEKKKDLCTLSHCRRPLTRLTKQRAWCPPPPAHPPRARRCTRHARALSRPRPALARRAGALHTPARLHRQTAAPTPLRRASKSTTTCSSSCSSATRVSESLACCCASLTTRTPSRTSAPSAWISCAAAAPAQLPGCGAVLTQDSHRVAENPHDPARGQDHQAADLGHGGAGARAPISRFRLTQRDVSKRRAICRR